MSRYTPTRWSRQQCALENAPDSDSWRPSKRPSRIPNWIPRPLRGPLRFALKAGVLLPLLCLAIALFYSCLAFRYDLKEVASMPERSVVLDIQDREIATLHGENRRLLTREEIPPFFVQALQAREDKRFFEHHGVDVMGLLRATQRNLRDRSFTQGASTLSMQLARNSYSMHQRSLHRKLLEIAITLRIESHYSKDEILTSYLNRIYFGSGCHGLDEAARTYFGIPASELTPNQCALLAGIIRAPHACSPLRNLKGALKQRDEVLDRMVDEEYITQENADSIRMGKLGLLSEPNHGTGGIIVPLIRRHFEELLKDSDINDGGLVLKSTISAGIQFILEEELARFIDTLPDGVEIAAVILNPQTGGIEAARGGRTPRPTRFHRALDARRDLGSIFTPFVLTAAAERGHPIRESAVTTGTRIGNPEMERLAKRFGFTGPFGKGRDLYRGTLSTTPLELAAAAAVLSNGGQRPRTHLIQELRNADGAVVFKNAPSLTPAFSAAAIRESLSAVFPAKTTRILTGSSPADTDAWGLSLSPSHVICIWAGHDRPRALPETLILKDLTALLDRLTTRLHR